MDNLKDTWMPRRVQPWAENQGRYPMWSEKEQASVPVEPMSRRDEMFKTGVAVITLLWAGFCIWLLYDIAKRIAT